MLPYVPAGYAPANRLRATCDCSDRRQQRYTLDLDLRDQEAVEGIRDALETVLGVLAGHSPAAPSSFSVRGFTRSQITVLRDGIRVRFADPLETWVCIDPAELRVAGSVHRYSRLERWLFNGCTASTSRSGTTAARCGTSV